MLYGFSALQLSQDFHVAVEARRATGEVLREKRIGFLGVLSQTNQVGIRRAVEAPWVGEGLGKILLGEAKEFFLVNVLSLLFGHWLALPIQYVGSAFAPVLHGSEPCCYFKS